MQTKTNRATSRLMMIVAFVLTFIAGCSSTSDAPGQVIQPQRLMEYIIGPSDVLSISVLNQDNLDRTVTVRPDGMISFPLIEEVNAAGLTPAQLEELMAASLSEYVEILPGELSVTVDEVHSYTVSVLGEVRNPGRFEFTNSATVLDALALAGGLTEFASADDIMILRNQPDGIRRIRFNYKELMKDPDGSVELGVYPGDTVLVP
ncbi:MAG TPA: polysaccharide biosynthesis/export family protein [Pseudomonadales bacterium]